MFTFEGVEYKSKSVVARDMLTAGKGRMEIAKALDITYQTVHAIMKAAGIKPALRAKKEVVAKKTTKTVKTEVKTETAPVAKKVTKKSKKPVTPVVDEVVADIADAGATV